MANIKGLMTKKLTPEKEMMRELNEIEVVTDLRGYNGLSNIGEKCVRKLQFIHYDCYVRKNTIRMLRLFNEGHRMEPVIREELEKRLGIFSHSDQHQVIGFAGHWKGHIDGLGEFKEGTKFYNFVKDVFLTEFKTHNDKYFTSLKKDGVRKSFPKHFDQTTAYMGYMKIQKCLYVGYNKNTSEIYIEWIDFDADHFKELQRKEAEVVMADTLLPRIGNDSPMWFECKLCDCAKTCFGKTPIKKSCKNCEFVDVLQDGKWACNKHKKDLVVFEPCGEYQLMGMLCQLN